MVKIKSFSSAASEWLETILFERFGIKLQITQYDSMLFISILGKKRKIRFDTLEQFFHENNSDFPCYFWKASSEGFEASIDDLIPAPSKAPLIEPLVEFSDSGAVIHYDILGLTYWMLARIEEIGRQDLDRHQRFPAVASHAYSHGYLERPIVDEWLIILGQVISKVWPHVKQKNHSFRMKVSHDVDVPSLYAFKPWTKIARMMFSFIVKRLDLKSALLAPYIKIGTIKKLHPLDPCNTFDWLMDQSDEQNIISAFYFICGNTDANKDADYSLEHPAIRRLLRDIYERGHEIGLHPSYNTFRAPQLIKNEADRLRSICEEEGIKQDNWGGRMHYLRWEQPVTLCAWDSAGMTYDSTLGYADRPGFRCGTCHEYPGFNAVTQEKLKIRVRPLIVMECTIIERTYLGLGLSEEATEKMQKLKNNCRKVSGTFSLLWHNSFLKSEGLKSLYKTILRS